MPPPTKNKADKNWLDRVPPTMLRDMRQSLQAPVHIGLLCIAVLFTYLLGSGFGNFSWNYITSFPLLTTAGLIPIHIGMNVAADIKAGSSNFLKLCPLPAGNIIWGQFLSGIAQMGVVLLLLSPMYLAGFGDLCQNCDYQPYFWGAERSLGSLAALTFLLMLLVSCLSLALTMMLAWLPMVLRLALQMALGITYLSCQVALSNNYNNPALYAPDFVAYFPALFIGGILATIACLLLARRHYQAATEHRSGGVRLIALLMLALPALNESLAPHGGL
ncbi:MAG: hypothetical protein R3Y56_09745, partial [Akkermansia sp.]